MLEELLARLGRALDAAGLEYMLIGGQAVLLHGQPRLTRDVDITLGVDCSQLPRVLAVTRELRLEVQVPDVERFVQRTNVLPACDPVSRLRFDFIFSFSPYEAQALKRAVRVPVGGHDVAFAAAEDLILHKLFAGRPRDVEDVRGVLARKRSALDIPYLRRWAKELGQVEGKAAMPADLESLLAEYGAA